MIDKTSTVTLAGRMLGFERPYTERQLAVIRKFLRLAHKVFDGPPLHFPDSRGPHDAGRRA